MVGLKTIIAVTSWTDLQRSEDKNIQDTLHPQELLFVFQSPLGEEEIYSLLLMVVFLYCFNSRSSKFVLHVYIKYICSEPAVYLNKISDKLTCKMP